MTFTYGKFFTFRGLDVDVDFHRWTVGRGRQLAAVGHLAGLLLGREVEGRAPGCGVAGGAAGDQGIRPTNVWLKLFYLLEALTSPFGRGLPPCVPVDADPLVAGGVPQGDGEGQVAQEQVRQQEHDAALKLCTNCAVSLE